MKRRTICISVFLLFTVKLFSEDYWFWQNTKKFTKQNYEYHEECYISKSSGMTKDEFYEICEENFEEAVFDNFLDNVSIKHTTYYFSQGFYTIIFSSLLDDSAQQVSVFFCSYGEKPEQLYRNIYVDSFEVALQDYNTKCKRYKIKLNE